VPPPRAAAAAAAAVAAAAATTRTRVAARGWPPLPRRRGTGLAGRRAAACRRQRRRRRPAVSAAVMGDSAATEPRRVGAAGAIDVRPRRACPPADGWKGGWGWPPEGRRALRRREGRLDEARGAEAAQTILPRSTRVVSPG